jgi:HAMP domain
MSQRIWCLCRDRLGGLDPRVPRGGHLSGDTDIGALHANGSLSHRIQLEGRTDEFRELADAFDTMLARLEAHVAEQQRFADEQQRFAVNASHKLRTPLAITQTLLDVARNDPSRGNGALIDRLYAVNTRAIGLTEALLQLSRADQRSVTSEDVDLSLVVEEAAEPSHSPPGTREAPRHSATTRRTGRRRGRRREEDARKTTARGVSPGRTMNARPIPVYESLAAASRASSSAPRTPAWSPSSGETTYSSIPERSSTESK